MVHKLGFKTPAKKSLCIAPSRNWGSIKAAKQSLGLYHFRGHRGFLKTYLSLCWHQVGRVTQGAEIRTLHHHNLGDGSQLSIPPLQRHIALLKHWESSRNAYLSNRALAFGHFGQRCPSNLSGTPFVQNPLSKQSPIVCMSYSERSPIKSVGFIPRKL